ncbi:MAG: hypothetical protein JWM47_2381, partial [Acidimicrobiales bacterium]|nr:hypothetical protein [Acidimicrobiales bacterium]
GSGGLPPAGRAAPKIPKPGSTAGSTGSRSTYRSGGTIAPGSGADKTAVEPDTYDERLPYEPQATGRNVEVAGPDTARTVSRTVSTPRAAEPGLLVPLAVVSVLLAGSVQIRAFLRRTARPANAVAVEPLDA